MCQTIEPEKPPFTKEQLKLVAQVYLDFTAPLSAEEKAQLSKAERLKLVFMEKAKEQGIKQLPKLLDNLEQLSGWPQLKEMPIGIFFAALAKVIELDNGAMVADNGCKS